jgi:hypothetical protein
MKPAAAKLPTKDERRIAANVARLSELVHDHADIRRGLLKFEMKFVLRFIDRPRFEALKRIDQATEFPERTSRYL